MNHSNLERGQALVRDIMAAGSEKRGEAFNTAIQVAVALACDKPYVPLPADKADDDFYQPIADALQQEGIHVVRVVVRDDHYKTSRHATIAYTGEFSAVRRHLIFDGDVTAEVEKTY